MISFTGKYWSTGITLAWREAYLSHGESWSGSLDYFDDGFASDNPDTATVSTEGTLRTSYGVEHTGRTDALALVIDTLIADAEKLGIEFRERALGFPMLYYRVDGEAPDCPPPPNYRELLAEQARRIGWATYGYEPAVKAGA